MYYQKRELKNGDTYYSFIYFNARTQKNVRLTKDEIIKRFGKLPASEKEAKKCVKLLVMLDEVRRIELKRLQAWKSEYLDFEKLFDEFVGYIKRRCPNSFYNPIFYLENYAFNYFLQIRKLGNVLMWADQHYEFKKWLTTKAITIKHERKLSKSSQNHCVKALNNFYKFLEAKREFRSLEKMKTLGINRESTRGVDDLIMPDEFEPIFKGLLKYNPKIAELYRLLYFTGMRLNEGIGISLADLYDDTEDSLGLKQYGYKIYAHIVLQSQPKNTPLRDKHGKVARKPLKSKKSIHAKYNRHIPITDKKLYNILAKHYNEQMELFDKGKYGKNKVNYLFFDGLTKSMVSRAVRVVFEDLKIKYRSLHCTRHSFSTFLIQRTKNYLIARTVLGHASLEMTDSYIHLAELLSKTVKRTKLPNKRMKILK